MDSMKTLNGPWVKLVGEPDEGNAYIRFDNSCSSVVALQGAGAIDNADLAKYRNGNYLLISPCRDEAEYMRETLESVIVQSVRPAKWIIVDDGSSDSTPQILAEYRAKHDWIEVVTRS